jgi:hypothetical protein
MVAPRALLAVNYHQAGFVARLNRGLRYQIVRKLEVEL